MNAELSLEGRVAVVTGGGRGLGRAMTHGLARAGATVIATAARERDEVERVAAEAGPNGRVVPIVADVTREEDCRRVVGTALDRFGRIDVLVNNAGRGMKYVSDQFMTEPTRFWETALDVWRMVMDDQCRRPIPYGAHRGAADAGCRVGTHHQCLDQR